MDRTLGNCRCCALNVPRQPHPQPMLQMRTIAGGDSRSRVPSCGRRYADAPTAVPFTARGGGEFPPSRARQSSPVADARRTAAYAPSFPRAPMRHRRPPVGKRPRCGPNQHQRPRMADGSSLTVWHRSAPPTPTIRWPCRARSARRARRRLGGNLFKRHSFKGVAQDFARRLAGQSVAPMLTCQHNPSAVALASVAPKDRAIIPIASDTPV